MDFLNRRDAFPMLLALSALTSADALAQDGSPMARSRVIRFDELNAVRQANGGLMRRVMSGTLPTGEFVEIHESMLPAGKMPHPPHKHPNTEWLFIQAGKLEYLDDGKAIPVNPGDIVFSASNIMHGLRNVGDTDASYIVVSVGKQNPE
jgi:XRE family transcriptional regulator, regulator of sulfur utilization